MNGTQQVFKQGQFPSSFHISVGKKELTNVSCFLVPFLLSLSTMNRLPELESVYKDYSIETKTEKGAYTFIWDHKLFLGISERWMGSKTVSKK